MPGAFDGYLPSDWDEREAERKAAEDLQIWLRHGRIGTGRGYAAEVERARKIEAASALPSAERGGGK
jgi:hypothetical protein